MTSNADSTRITGLAEAPEIFAEGYRGYVVRNGVITLNFFSQYFDAETETLNKRGAVKLTMPLPDLLEVADELGRLAEQVRSQLAATSSDKE